VPAKHTLWIPTSEEHYLWKLAVALVSPWGGKIAFDIDRTNSHITTLIFWVIYVASHGLGCHYSDAIIRTFRNFCGYLEISVGPWQFRPRIKFGMCLYLGRMVIVGRQSAKDNWHNNALIASYLLLNRVVVLQIVSK
jgi:hypothetical protein